MPTPIGKPSQQANAKKPSLKPPKTVRSNYKRGLELHEEGKTGDGIESGTIKVARDIVAGEAVTESWARKANRFWGRNERFLDEPADSAAYASAMLWGGAAGRDWYASVVRKLDEVARNEATAYNAGKVKGDLMTDQVRVNVTQKVNNDKIKREKRNGRDVIVVQSATLPDDVVMNGIKYPAQEIEAGYKSLENTPAPLGHPMIGNAYVSAKDPEGLNVGWFGAWNANVRREDGRVMIDKVIDVERAEESKLGKRVLEAINKGEPIHTSTGLLCNLREIDDDEAEFEAYNMEFDHDAVLLDEQGAATPEQGVGMMVNGERIKVINSRYEENMDEHIDMLGQELMRAMERREDASKWARIKSAVIEAMGLGRENETKSDEVSEMTEVTKEQFDELSAKVNELADGFDKLDFKGALDEAIKPLVEAQNAAKEAAEAEAKEKHNAAVERVVNKGILSEEDAKATPLAVLEKLVNAKGEAAGIAGGFKANGDEIDFSPLAEEDK